MIDENKLTPYYTKIAQKLDEMIPVEWKKIIMYAEEFGDERSASFYFYTKQDDNIHYSENIIEEFKVESNVFKELWRELININKELWLAFKKAGERKWYTLTFYLEDDGKFKLNYGYEINLEIDGLERQIRWAYDELNIVPEDDYEKELLEEYLEEKKKVRK